MRRLGACGPHLDAKSPQERKRALQKDPREGPGRPQELLHAALRINPKRLDMGRRGDIGGVKGGAKKNASLSLAAAGARSRSTGGVRHAPSGRSSSR